MPEAVANGITLDWSSFGEPGGEPLVLIMGLSAQQVLWPEGLCRALADRGFYVVRFDNRDIGKSTKLNDAGQPRIVPRYLARIVGVNVRPPYSLSDMARDTIGLMDALGIERAHVVGMSMGGMIAQTLAIEHPRRLRSFVSMASTPGDRGLPLPSLPSFRALLERWPKEREAAIRHGVGVLRTISSPIHFDPARTRALIELGLSRSTERRGVARQIAAIIAAPRRGRLLRHVRVPATVIHGRLDPLLPLAHGEATARAIPNARLVVLDEMGHDLPEALWPAIVDAIAKNAKRAA